MEVVYIRDGVVEEPLFDFGECGGQGFLSEFECIVEGLVVEEVSGVGRWCSEVVLGSGVGRRCFTCKLCVPLCSAHRGRWGRA